MGPQELFFANLALFACMLGCVLLCLVGVEHIAGKLKVVCVCAALGLSVACGVFLGELTKMTW